MVKLSRLGGNENIPRPNRYRNFERLDKTARLMAAMTCVECGIPMKQVDTKAIWQGYDLAYPSRREKYDVTYRHSDQPSEEVEEENEEEPSDRQLARIERLSVWDEYWDWSGFG